MACAVPCVNVTIFVSSSFLADIVVDTVLYGPHDVAVELLFSHYQSKVAHDMAQTSAQGIKMVLVQHIGELTKLMTATESATIPKSFIEDLVASASAALNHPVSMLEQATKKQKESQDDLNFLIPTYFCNGIQYDEGGSLEHLLHEMETIHKEAYTPAKQTSNANTKSKASSNAARSPPRATKNGQSVNENTHPNYMNEKKSGHPASRVVKPSARDGDAEKGSSPLLQPRNDKRSGPSCKSISSAETRDNAVSKNVKFQFLGATPCGSQKETSNEYPSVAE